MDNYATQIDDKLNELKNNSKKFLKFLDKITSLNPIIIGGFIRNIINDEPVRDIDIILNSNDDKQIEKIIKIDNLKYKINSFKGYKIFIDNYTIDIWYLKNHNLFKEGIYEPTINNLNETTFINYDSLVYDLNNKQLNINHYLESINNNMINFVGTKEAIENNKQTFLSIGKIFLISYKKKMDISEEIKEYILRYYTEYPDFMKKLKNEYVRHYNLTMDEDLEEFIETNIKQYMKKRTN